MHTAGFSLLKLLIFALSFCVVDAVAVTYKSVKRHAIAMHGEPKLGVNDSFTYVNVNAPKGGELKMGAVGTFDSFNPFITKGRAPSGLYHMAEQLVFDSLMIRAQDEPFSLYGLIAQTVEMPEDRSWIIFNINPAARWADGKPITTKDVVFTYNILKEKGRLNLRAFYAKVAKVEKLGDLKVIFHLKKTNEGIYDPELPLLIAMMSILPSHLLAGKDIEKLTNKPLIGNGPYRVADYKMGKYVTYERRKDYWAWELPILRGLYNFDRVRFEYFGTEQVEFEAFKAGENRVRAETDPKKWQNAYNFEAVNAGKVIKEEFTHQRPVGMTSLTFNTRRELFKDWRVRRAIGHLFDFKWINTTLYLDQATRTKSYFDNCELTPHGLPDGKELDILSKFKDQVRPEVFTTEYQIASEKFNGDLRTNLKEAISLFAQAGWTIKNNQLVDKNGKQFAFQILVHDDKQKRNAIHFANILKQRLGIKVEIRSVDIPQYIKRLVAFDYDAMYDYVWHSLSPGREQMNYFSSKAANDQGSRNYAGIKNPVIDEVCNILATAKDKNTLVGAAKALGRLLNWEEKVLPLYHMNKTYIAHWDDLDHPKFRPDVLIYFTTWWSKNAEKK